MTINNRIKKLRRALDITQVEFAKAIHISNGYIAELEIEHRRVNDRLVHLISLTFGASEKWLKTGEGGMFLAAQDEKSRYMAGMFNQLPEKYQDYVLRQIERLKFPAGELAD